MITIKSSAKMVALFFLFSRVVVSKEYFDPMLLQSIDGKQTITDTSMFSTGGQPPGVYRVNVKVNEQTVLNTSLEFKQNDTDELVPCMSFDLYKKLGLDMEKLTANAKDNAKNSSCTPIESQFPDVKATFNFSNIELNIAVPQSMLDEQYDVVPVEEWDDGVPAILSNYQLSGQKYIGGNTNSSDSVFLNLQNGINIGRWRLRNNSTVSEEGTQNLSTYIETAISEIKGELTVGDSNTSGEIFDSYSLRGIQIASDDDMRADQLTGFAPLIHGIAKSNAVVKIQQNGHTIYQRNVPAGPFTINDLSSVSDGGKLDVIVTEADGSETHTTVSYANVPQLLRTGQVEYNVALGKAQSSSANAQDKDIIQSSLSVGLPLDTTLYGGIQYQNKFSAVDAGLGVNLHSIGGIAIDMMKNESHFKSRDHSGKMIRMAYRNYLDATNTQIELDQRFYQDQFISFSDWSSENYDSFSSQKKNEYNLNINQSVDDKNNFFITLNRSENKDDSVSRSWMLGWNSSWKYISYSINYSMSKDSSNPEWDKQLSLNLSVPFFDLFPKTHPVLNYTATSGLKGDLSNQLGMTGTINGDSNLNWNTQVSYASQPGQTDTTSGSAGIDYQGSRGDMNVTYNADRNNYISWNASGSIVGHRHGITFGRTISGSAAIVAVPGIDSVPLSGGYNITTDRFGYAIYPDLRPYHRNTVNVDVQNDDRKLDFDTTSKNVVPTKDAIIWAPFKAINGHKAVFNVIYNQEPLQFGIRAKVDGDDKTYYIGDNGQLYVNVENDSGNIKFYLDDGLTCNASYDFPPTNDRTKILVKQLECR